MSKAKPIEKGTRFGRLVTTGEYESRRHKIYEKCICDCGIVKWISRFELTSGRCVSCGCFRKEIAKASSYRHGMTKTRIYKTFMEMQRRCNCEGQTSYAWYGGRGIKCLWDSFEEFYKDMGASYEDHVKEFGEKNTSIDRINSDGDYCKENCRWATMKEQNNNRRSNRIITYKGVTYPSMKIICEKLGLNYKRFKKRLEDGWDVTTAVETPKNGKYKSRNT